MSAPRSHSAMSRTASAIDVPGLEPRRFEVTVRRNTFILAVCLAITWAVTQLYASLGAITTKVLTGDAGLAGLGPAVGLAATAVGAVVMGRLMDRFGRVPGIALGFVSGAAGGAVIFAAIGVGSPGLFFAGMALVGFMGGAVGLARAGAADMYPPIRRGRGIGLVLLGAAAGTVLGPVLFAPFIGGRGADASSLASPWVVATALMVLGSGVVLLIRIDPIRIARWWHTAQVVPGTEDEGDGTARSGRAENAGPAARRDPRRRPLLTIYGTAGTQAALLSLVAAQAVMTSSMSLIPLVMAQHGHDLGTVSVTISAHMVGMFVLAPFMGALTDRLGRRRSLVIGLFVLAGAVLGLQLGLSTGTLLPSMFLVGVGWNIAYVAGTALIGDETAAHERAAALGAADFLALSAAAVGSYGAGWLLPGLGLQPVALAASLVAILPAVVLTRANASIRPAAMAVPGRPS